MLETAPTRSGRRREGRERRRGLAILLVLILLFGGTVAGFSAYYAWGTGASGPQTKVVISIPRGATGTQVADLLKEKGVIRSAFVFRLLIKLRHLAGIFKAGEYNLTTNMAVSDVIDALKQGPFLESVTVTFPEGLTMAQTGARAAEALGMSQEDFINAAKSGTFVLAPYLPAGTKSVEGFLFPQTYDFLQDTTPAQLIQRLLGEFKKECQALPWSKVSSLGISDFQAVIVASMIEREAKFQADRPLVAAVIYNRLKKGMPLQIDATVEYALGTYKAKLTYADLQVKSPYNTYLHTGLPPGPIASPGLASIAAALDPASVDYLYYVADSSGHNHYASTYQEFLQLKAKYTG